MAQKIAWVGVKDGMKRCDSTTRYGTRKHTCAAIHNTDRIGCADVRICCCCWHWCRCATAARFVVYVLLYSIVCVCVCVLCTGISNQHVVIYHARESIVFVSADFILFRFLSLDIVVSSLHSFVLYCFVDFFFVFISAKCYIRFRLYPKHHRNCREKTEEWYWW